MVDSSKEMRDDAAIARKTEHHAGITGHAEQSAVPDTDDDEYEEDRRTGFAEDVEAGSVARVGRKWSGWSDQSLGC